MSPLLASEYLQGIYERLSVADQNIRNLDTAISEFLKPLPTVEIKVDNGQSVITDSERDGWSSLQKCASETIVPPEFSIRAGEVIHHLRSCLDHVVWHLCDRIKREAKPGNVQFPVILDWRDKKEVSRYERYTEYIINPTAKAIIHDLQPARLDAPKDDFIWIVHDLDIRDKHRELIVIPFAPRMQGPSRVTRDYAPIQDGYGTRMLIPILGTAKVYAHMKISLDVKLSPFGRGESEEPVIKSLSNLTDRIREVIGLFA